MVIFVKVVTFCPWSRYLRCSTEPREQNYDNTGVIRLDAPKFRLLEKHFIEISHQKVFFLILVSYWVITLRTFFHSKKSDKKDMTLCTKDKRVYKRYTCVQKTKFCTKDRHCVQKINVCTKDRHCVQKINMCTKDKHVCKRWNFV